MLGIQDVIGVANHPHHAQAPQQPFRLLLRERPAFGDKGQPRHNFLMLVVFDLLLVAERHEEISVGALGQVRLHVRFAPAQHLRFDALVELIEVPVARRAATFIQIVILAVEPEQRSEQRWVQKVHERIQLVDAVFDRRPGQHKGVATAQPLDCLGRFGAPILDPLRFIEHHDVRPQPLVHLERIRQHLLVVHDGEERMWGRRDACHAVARGAICLEPRHPPAIDQLIAQLSEPLDLLLPLRLQRRRGDHQHPVRPAQTAQQRAGGDGLDGLPQPHFISQQRPFGERQVQHALALIRKQRNFRLVDRPFAVLYLEFVFVPKLLALRYSMPALQPQPKFLRQPQFRHFVRPKLL